MKIKQKISYLIGILCSVGILYSCTTSSSENEMVKGEEAIDNSLLSNWDKARLDKDQVTKIFSSSSNTFHFTKEAFSSKVHAYLGYNPETESLSFTIVTAESDTVGNTSFLAQSILGSEKEELSFFSTTAENANSIPWDVAHERISNWNNDNIRNQWIEERFVNNPSELGIVKLFIIPENDFNYGDTHQCYLGLKEVQKDGEPIRYQVDLIVVNTFERSGGRTASERNVEDMATPVPPFPPSAE
ncbi:hypothetical protein KMW28_22985 [Flammeovirga yaeyamensis]|uniref:Lipoprotein n=1 Tax=Flammeovirga yaeyamensis TaxID=367791 RepID=A0AAX1NCG8_9BACT|nr:hypothetical protein [Flammeovirga yaeyamensis]MBB3696769.1 hypothetical protein [Flammeovirga yaeyamensis]NMF33436.1 hypothetical protein [Flammeovirga yaeyamensis]QWG05289.1 hypothetical protein KMW28_22985 [Flammeovirga yaeyamensis]